MTASKNREMRGVFSYILFAFSFSFFVIFSIWIQSGAEAVEMLNCNYAASCYVYEADFTEKTISETFKFSGTLEEKENTTSIDFQYIGRVAHVPKDLVEEFPKLIDLSIWQSEIPIVKNNLFGPQFGRIKVLKLTSNKIKIIEEGAFAQLPNLVQIWLQYNEIQSLGAGVFENNRQLEIILLDENKINMISPETFQSLNQLTWVILEKNNCINKEFGCEWSSCNATIDHSELNSDLRFCYYRYKRTMELVNLCKLLK
jgi:hypothetical protein